MEPEPSTSWGRSPTYIRTPLSRMAAWTECSVPCSWMQPSFHNCNRSCVSELTSKKGGWFWQVQCRDRSLKIPFHDQKIAGVKANRYENTVCSGSPERTGERWNPNAGQSGDPFGLLAFGPEDKKLNTDGCYSTLKERQPRPPCTVAGKTEKRGRVQRLCHWWETPKLVTP